MNRKHTGRRRRPNSPRAMRIEALERREVFAAVTGNTAPGGFEALNSAALLYWLNPSSIAQGNNTAVATWNNQGSVSNNFTQSTPVKQPLYQTSGLGPNGMPAVKFDGDVSGNSAGIAPNADELVLTNSTSPTSVFIVNSTELHRGLDGIWGWEANDVGFRRQSAAQWQSQASGGNSNDYPITGSVLTVNGATTNAAALNTPHLVSVVRPSGTTFGQTSIGDYFKSGTVTPRSWAGLIGDVIAFNRTLTDSERIIIENSLTAKYGLPMAANDRYQGDDALLGNYDFDVFGAALSALSSGQSGFGIEIAAPGASDYVFAGHKTATNSIVTTDLPGGISQRWDRTWYVDETGTTNVTLAFDFSDAGLAAPGANISSYRLLYSPNNNFEGSESAFQSLTITPTINGDTITFAVPDGTLLDGYYTLGLRETPSVVYVDDAWTGFAVDTAITNADSGTPAAEGAAFGYNAFSSVTAAIAAVGTNGVIVVNDGTYNEGTVPNLDAGKTLRLTGSNNGTSNSTITISSLNAASGTTVNLQTNALRIGDNTGDNLIEAAVQGTGSLTKLGTDMLDIRGTNSFSGGTTVAGGRLRMFTAGALGTGTINVGAGNYVMLWFNTGVSTVTNNWVLNAPGNIPEGGGMKTAIYGDGGGAGFRTYTLSGDIELVGNSNIGGNNVNDITVTGRIFGAGGLTKGGGRGDEENTLTLTNPLNSYAGATAVTKGTLLLGASNVIPDTSNVTVAAGKTLNLAEFSETVNGIGGSGTVTAVKPLEQFFFNTDRASLISGSKTYTHLLDFANDGAAAVVNGVTFTANGTEAGSNITGPNWTLAVPPTIGKIGEGSGGTLPTQLDDLGMERLYRDFYYTATSGTATSVLTLTGLTPGVTYETRLYNRQWSTPAPRTHVTTFNHGQAVPDVVTVNQDASATPNFVSYRYTAASTTLTITFASAAANASYHFYGMTNEVAISAPTLTVTGNSPADAGTLTLAGGALNVLGTTGGSVTVNNGASLTGTGTVNGLATINTGGKLSPGTSVGTAGILTATNGVVLAGNYVADIATPNDRLNVTGAVNLTGSTLNYSLNNLPHTPGTRYVLIGNDGSDAVTGTFNGLAEGAVIDAAGALYRVTYTYNATTQTLGDGNDVALIRNDDLTAEDDSFTMLQNTVLNGTVADNDVDEDGDGVYSVVPGMGPANGTLTLDPVTGEFTYTPDANFMGTDTFTYELADDETGFTQTAVVTIRVTNMFIDDEGSLRINGGEGNDRIIISRSSARIAVRYNNAASYWTGVTNKVIIFGQEGNDTITVSGNIGVPVEFYGGIGNDYLAGGNYDDILDGGEGSDRLLAGAGNDQLYGGPGADTLAGGLGNDLIDGDRYFAIDESNIVGDLLLPDVSQQGRDTLSGDNGNDVIFGWGAVDNIAGGANDDLVIGGLAGDNIRSGAGNDLLYGGDLLTDDAITLATLADYWFSGDVAQVISEIQSLGDDDLAADSLNGEAGADVYLLWLLDRITTTPEKKAPNESIPLY